jgi:hypothetical protein
MSAKKRVGDTQLGRRGLDQPQLAIAVELRWVEAARRG